MKKSILLFTITLLLLANFVRAQNWITQDIDSSGTGISFSKVRVINNNTAWGLLPYKNLVCRTIDGGLNWESDSIPFTVDGNSFDALSADTAWFATWSVADSTQLWKTTDGGQSWNMITGAGTHCDFIHFFNSNEAVAFGDPDSVGWYVLTTNDGGGIWNRVSVPVPISSEYAMDEHQYVFGDNVWTPTTKGRIYYSNDKGNTWNVSLIDSADFPDNFRLAFYSATEGIAIRHDAFTGGMTGVYRSHDGGISWSIVPHSGTAFQSFFGGLFIVPNTDVIIANGEGADFYGSSYSIDSGVTWIAIDTINKYGGLDGKDWNSIWAGQYILTPGVGGAVKWDGTVLNISDNIEENIFSCYPNPVNNFILVTSQNKLDEIQIIDLLGKTVRRLPVNGTEALIDLSNIEEGIYSVRVLSENKIYTHKIIKL